MSIYSFSLSFSLFHTLTIYRTHKTETW